MKFLYSLSLVGSILFGTTNLSGQNIALNFDGTDDNVQTTYPGIGGQDPRTVEAIIRTSANCDPNNGGKQKVIVDWGTMSTGNRFTLNILWSNALRLEVGGSGISGKKAINDGKWHHVAVTYDPTVKTDQIRLYVDGVLDVTGDLSTLKTSNSKDLIIGERIDGINNFDGDIDEVRVFSNVRSASDIKGDMDKEYCKFPKGLVAYYKLNEGTPTSNNSSNKTAKDYISNKNGTLNNFTLSGSSSNWIKGDTLTGGDTRSDVTAFGCYSYTDINGTVYTSPGKYKTVTTNAAGCDSTITLDLTLGRVYHFTRHTVCDSFVSPLGNVYYSTGFYRDTLFGVTPKGCDSVLIMEVLVNKKQETSETITACDSVEIQKNWYFKDEAIEINDKAYTGCDSTHTIQLKVNYGNTNTIYETHCDRFKSNLGNTYTKSGLYSEKLSKANQFGCDSLIYIDLTINESVAETVPVTSCDSFQSPGNMTYYKTGEYIESYTTAAGCDSVLTYDVTINDTKTAADDIEACDSAQINGIWYTNTGEVNYTSKTASGCDSMVTIQLVVTDVDNGITVTGKTLTADQVGATYQWVDCNNGKNLSGETSSTFNPKYASDFAVDVTVNKCTKRSQCVNVIPAGILYNTVSNKVLVSPNPSKGAFVITSKEGKNIKRIVVTDLLGKKITDAEYNDSSIQLQTELPAGFYLLQIEIDGGVLIQKVKVQ